MSMDDTSEVLFTWLHLSDIHYGHGPTSHRWDQKLVLQALSDDVGRLADRGIPQPDIVLITGDIAFSGAQQEYEGAAIWLQQIADAFNLSPSDVMAIPGNHDVQRNIDVEDRQVRRLIDRLRNGDDLWMMRWAALLIGNYFQNDLRITLGSPNVFLASPTSIPQIVDSIGIGTAPLH